MTLIQLLVQVTYGFLPVIAWKLLLLYYLELRSFNESHTLPACSCRYRQGQKYAQIMDFRTADGDKIRLPGSADDYVAETFGANNNDTAIFYVADQDIDVGFSADIVSFGTDLALDLDIFDPGGAIIDQGAALFALIKDNVIRNMFNENIYEYTGI